MPHQPHVATVQLGALYFPNQSKICTLVIRMATPVQWPVRPRTILFNRSHHVYWQCMLLFLLSGLYYGANCNWISVLFPLCYSLGMGRKLFLWKLWRELRCGWVGVFNVEICVAIHSHLGGGSFKNENKITRKMKLKINQM